MPRLFPALLLAGLFLPIGLHAQDTTKTAPKIRRNPDLISAQEIAQLPDARTALSLVEQLRPNWLKVRGGSSISLTTPGVQVYVDGVRMNGQRALADVTRESIKEIQHVRGTDASQRFGVDHENGAILIIRK